MNLSYPQRAELAQHPVARHLFNLMENKKTNLALSADVASKHALLKLADELGPEICVLKTHIDIIEDFDQDLTIQLKKLANKHNFLLFEDRKFADIGHTVQLQYRGGIYRIAEWADIVTVHSVPGPGIIQAFKNPGKNSTTGLLLLAEMSSQGNLAQGQYTDATVNMALQNKDCVIGFITQHKLIDDPAFINMTPGIGLTQKNDSLGQQYISPQNAILQNSTDIIIVGRNIYQAESPLKAAQLLRAAGWDAYLQRGNKIN